MLRRRRPAPQEGAGHPQNPQPDPQPADPGEAELAKWRALPPLEVPGYDLRGRPEDNGALT